MVILKLKLELNPKDKMTPIERAKAISNGDDYDRIAIDPFLGEIKARYIGKNTREYWLSEDNLVEAEVKAFNRFSADGMGVGPNAYGIAEAIGIIPYYPEQGLIYVEKHKIDAIEEVDNLDIINLDSGNLRMYYNATARLRELGDGICPVGASLSGPLTLAAFVLGTEKLLKAMIRKPDQVHKFLKYIEECVKLVVDEFSKLDISFSMADPIASNTMISPRMYKKYAFPYSKSICDYVIEKTGKAPSYHVCGNTEKSWEDIKKIDFGLFSIDNEMDIEKTCEFFKTTHAIAGNVDPVAIICNGTKDMIEQEVIRCIKAGKKCEKGYVLAPGCNLPLSTSDENIDAFMDAGRKYSKKIMDGKI